MTAVFDNLANEASSAERLPIREICRETGVNTVTLRAWERRYGLLVPQRTSKGHRLYSRADIERVKEIQLWLGRGLAISKIKALLADEQRNDVMLNIDSVWLDLAQQMQTAITACNRRLLERVIEDTFALYPIPMIADNLLLPLLLELQGDEPGKSLRRAFFTAVLHEHIHAAQNRQRQMADRAAIAVMSLVQGENPLLAQMLTYGLVINQYRAEYLGYLGAKESLLCAGALDAKLVMFVGDESVNTSELQLHLHAWRDLSAVPVVVVGGAVRILRALMAEPVAGIFYCDTHQQVQTTINQLIKG